ncbi:MAG: hypothetical protein QM759_04880 [Terricaulis sp.]
MSLPFIRADVLDRHEVRALNQPPAPSPRDLELAALEARIDALNAELGCARREAEARVAAAYINGRESAEADLESQHADVVRRLDATLADARAGFAQSLANLELLALAINETALVQVFEASSDLEALTARSIQRQVQHLRDASIVEIVVAAADFPDPTLLDGLRTRLATKAAIRIDATLEAGEARIGLLCGALELSRKDHWRALKDLFARLEAAP